MGVQMRGALPKKEKFIKKSELFHLIKKFMNILHYI